jgi:hypothetical protein
MDIWAIVQRLFNIKSLDYRLLGRWLGHMPKGKFVHQKIVDAPPIPYELALGWIAHYTIGIGIAFLLVALFGKDWLNEPDLLAALIIGISTVVLPYFVMQPAFGFGIAGCGLPDPALVRAKSMFTHIVFGIGLYLTAEIIQLIVN